MDSGWRFIKGDMPFEKGHGGWTKAGNFSMPPIDPLFDDSKWRLVNLPHDFVVEGKFNSVPNVSPDKGRRLWLEFDGVARDCAMVA